MPTDFDFAVDVASIAGDLARIVELREAIAEAKNLRDSTADHEQIIRQADAAVKKLDGIVRHRLQVIEECAREAEKVDGLLRAERARLELETRRDDVHGRLGAMLYGVEISPSSPPSDSVDAVKARAAAFRELKGTVEFPSDVDDAEGQGDGESWPATAVRDVLRWVGLGR